MYVLDLKFGIIKFVKCKIITCSWLLQNDENNAGGSLLQSGSRSGSIPSINQLPQFIDSLDVNTDAPEKDEGKEMVQ